METVRAPALQRAAGLRVRAPVWKGHKAGKTLPAPEKPAIPDMLPACGSVNTQTGGEPGTWAAGTKGTEMHFKKTHEEGMITEDVQTVGLGLATLDVMVRMKDLPTWDGGGRPVSAFCLEGGGMAATAMAAASRLGARAGFIGPAGSDSAGRVKIDSLASAGVDLSRLIVRDAPENQVVLVQVCEDTGERIFSALRSGSVCPLQLDELDRDYIIAAQYLLLDGVHHEAALQAAKWMRKAGKKVVCDAGARTGGISAEWRELLEYVDVLICAEGFAPALTGIADIEEAGRGALDAGPERVVQTLGGKGSCTTLRSAGFHTPAFNVEVIDTTGAGDVFHGAYIVGMLHGWDPENVALFASAAAALKCRRLGGRAGIPDMASVMEFLDNKGIVPDAGG